jgi:hypothetical protein
MLCLYTLLCCTANISVLHNISLFIKWTWGKLHVSMYAISIRLFQISVCSRIFIAVIRLTFRAVKINPNEHLCIKPLLCQWQFVSKCYLNSSQHFRRGIGVWVAHTSFRRYWKFITSGSGGSSVGTVTGRPGVRFSTGAGLSVSPTASRKLCLLVWGMLGNVLKRPNNERLGQVLALLRMWEVRSSRLCPETGWLCIYFSVPSNGLRSFSSASSANHYSQPSLFLTLHNLRSWQNIVKYTKPAAVYV